MIPDVRMSGYQPHARQTGDLVDPRHKIYVENGTEFLEIVGVAEGEVNTSHHQAVDKLGRDLKRTAYSPDGLVEGLEWERSGKKSFLQLVQWHPERMPEFESPFSKGLL